MILDRSWNRLYEIAREHNILKRLGGIISKRDNAVYESYHTMTTIFRGFLQQLRIYHLPLKGVEENTSTDYRDLRRCTEGSYIQMREVLEGFLQR